MSFPGSFSFANADVLGKQGAEAAPPADSPADSKTNRKLPQQSLNEFWESLITKTPGKVFQIFPRSLYANLLPPVKPDGVASKKWAAASYEEAAQECRERVKRIERECVRTNEKFTDPDFDIENDWSDNCLNGLQIPSSSGSDNADQGWSSVGAGPLRQALGTLVQSNILGPQTSVVVDVSALQRALEDPNNDNSGGQMSPATMHRVDYIFDSPEFLVDGFSSSDVQQGSVGDCWWVAAVATLCSKPELVEKVCVARNAECGVYGFVFYRDGEWISTVVDDNLYVSAHDFDMWGDEYDATGEKERRYKERYQTGSEALYFSKCADPNEIWLPLLEKAYAKIHGDYDAIQAGNSGDAVEDMTGGVSMSISTNRILSKDKLWQEMLNVNKEFIFAASSPGWRDGQARQGVALQHAYSILKAVEAVGPDEKKVRLVLLRYVVLSHQKIAPTATDIVARNPWGKRAANGVGEWNGPWSDGSKEWTPYWIEKLDYQFGDDGEFWMAYNDLCRKFSSLHRTRLFSNEWLVVQQWTSVNVSWVSGYMTTKFVIEIKKGGTVVIVLSQLDSRYFKGLEGQYAFHLQFLLREESSKPGDYVVRTRPSQFSMPDRSISAEVDLEPGRYEVLPKISATRDTSKPVVEDVVKKAAEENPQKLRQIGLNYDIAHAKGGFEEEEDARKKRLAKNKKEDGEKSTKKAETETAKSAETDGVPAETKKDDGQAKSEVDKDPKVAKGEDGKANAETSKQEAAGSAVLKADADKDEAGSKQEEKADQTAEEKEKSDHTAEEKPDGEKNSNEAKPTDEKVAAADEPATTSPEPEPGAEPSADENSTSWNAVAVIGLRVYSKDPELAIKLVKPKDPEEAALLDVDGGVSGAGATT
ncbi:hypothetical protein H2200_010445 [Cladophialophora chaetospira]|uniref:Calpain catalytic domain-containing protein n=1 Tax=Cladophialophora chaetospira TaxID=386627 RepID=A0AA38X1G8_9EURO|nr:hypothetical protein H2200_010445 [Cladophialophora chaetospira]